MRKVEDKCSTVITYRYKIGVDFRTFNAYSYRKGSEWHMITAFQIYPKYSN